MSDSYPRPYGIKNIVTKDFGGLGSSVTTGMGPGKAFFFQEAYGPDSDVLADKIVNEPIKPSSTVSAFKLNDPEQLKNNINLSKELHLRPMSDSEYNQYLNMLVTGRDVYGKNLFKHELAGIARVIKENFLKFMPSTTLDPQVDRSLEFHAEIDPLLGNLYLDSLDKYRDVFTTTRAEEVMDLYTVDEKKRLRGIGLAFTDPKFSMLDEMNPEAQEMVVKKVETLNYAHPMLKYNLIKGK